MEEADASPSHRGSSHRVVRPNGESPGPITVRLGSSRSGQLFPAGGALWKPSAVEDLPAAPAMSGETSRVSSGQNASTVQAVIFDLDGTLVDTNDAHVEAWRGVCSGGYAVSRSLVRRAPA